MADLRRIPIRTREDLWTFTERNVPLWDILDFFPADCVGPRGPGAAVPDSRHATPETDGQSIPRRLWPKNRDRATPALLAGAEAGTYDPICMAIRRAQPVWADLTIIPLASPALWRFNFTERECDGD